MNPFLAIGLTVAALVVLVLGLWALAVRGNPSGEDFYGLAGKHYAHRGLHNAERSVPENSLKAFRLALRYGYGAELDVHLSRDKRLVVMHDENLARTTGADMNIAAVSSDTLDGLRLENSGEKVPYLEEVLPLFSGQQPLVIEIKPHGKNYARLTYRVCKLLDEYPDLQFCMESFDPRVLIWLRKNRPEIIRGQLSMNFIKDRSGLKWPMAFAMTNLLLNFLTQPDFVAYKEEDRKNLGLWMCKTLWRVQEFSWTVHSQERADELKAKNSILIFENFAAQ